MTTAPASPAARFRAGTYRVLAYLLFVTATFTIAGSEASIILLMLTALSDPELWRWVRHGAPPRALPYGGLTLPPWVWGPFLALVAVAILAALLSATPLRSFDTMRYHYRVFLPFVLLLALPRVTLARAFTAFAVFVALWSLYGAIQYRFGVDWFRPEGQKLIRPYNVGQGVFHAQGEFTHHVTYGGVMLMAAVFLLALGTGRGSGRPGQRWIWGGGAALGSLATTLSLARNAWLGMAVGVLVLAVLRLPRRWGAALVALAVATLAGYSTLALETTWLQAHLLEPGTPAIVQRLIRTSPANDLNRVRMWQSGWLAVQDRPWLGAGMGNAGDVLLPYREQISKRYDFRYQLEASEGLHDIYLQVTFDLGLIGLAAYLSVWGGIFAWGGRALRALAPGAPAAQGPEAGLYRAVLQGAVAGLAGSMAAGLFENNAYDKEVQGMMLILMGLTLYAGLRVLAESRGGGSRRAGAVHAGRGRSERPGRGRAWGASGWHWGRRS